MMHDKRYQKTRHFDNSYNVKTTAIMRNVSPAVGLMAITNVMSHWNEAREIWDSVLFASEQLRTWQRCGT
jgi:hypothetical protein